MKHWSHLVRLTLLAALLAGTALSVKPAVQVHAGTAITVTTDDDDPATNVNTNRQCSLREAIYNANASAPAD
jgi:CSLREA domain-containing protein